MISPPEKLQIGRKAIHNKIFYYGLILTVLTLPFSFFANSLCILLLSANWIVEGNISEKVKSLKDNVLFFLFIGFFALHLVGMLYTSDTRFGIFELQKKLSMLAFPLVLATSARLNSAQVKTILKAFLLAVLSAALICVGYAVYRTGLLKDPSHPNWLFFSYVDLTRIIKIQHTYLALYTSFSVIILLFFLGENFPAYRWPKRIVLLLLIFFLIFFLFLLASRITLAAFVLTSVPGIFFFFYKKKKILLGLMIIGALGIFLTAIIYNNPFIRERIINTFGMGQNAVWISQYGDGKGAPKEDRKLIWKCAKNVIKENWLIGTGTGDTKNAIVEEYKKIHFDVARSQEFNAHSQLLETWMGLGLIGLILFLTCLILPVISAFQQENYLYLYFLMIFLICSVTEALLERQHGIVFYSFFNSLFAFHHFKGSGLTLIQSAYRE